MKPRLQWYAAAVVSGILGVLTLAAPAWALGNGEVPQPLGTWTVVFTFIVPPVGGFLLIAALVTGPRLLKRPRYRPGRPWDYEPLWFGGPEDPEAALASARVGRTARGGASGDW